MLIAIVLRHGKHRRLRLGPHGLQNLLGANADHVLVRATELGIAVLTFFVDQGEILRVVVEVFLRRHQAGERVHEEPAPELHLAAAFRVEPAGARIHAVSRAPIAVCALVNIRLAIFERRNLAVVQRTDRQAGRPGNATDARRKPAAAQVIFQETVHAVHRAPHRPAGNDQMLADGPNHIAFFAEGGKIDRHAQFFQVGILAENDLLGSQRLLVVDDRQLCAADLAEEHLQFLGSVLNGRRGAPGHHNLIGRAATVGQHQFAGRCLAAKCKNRNQD